MNDPENLEYRFNTFAYLLFATAYTIGWILRGTMLIALLLMCSGVGWAGGRWTLTEGGNLQVEVHKRPLPPIPDFYDPGMPDEEAFWIGLATVNDAVSHCKQTQDRLYWYSANVVSAPDTIAWSGSLELEVREGGETHFFRSVEVIAWGDCGPGGYGCRIVDARELTVGVPLDALDCPDLFAVPLFFAFPKTFNPSNVKAARLVP